MFSLFSVKGALLIFSVSIAFLILRIIYRLTIHPLARFPGPKLAAATTLYNAYHDILRPGLIKQLPDLHQKYGPIIRIQPNELHVSSLESYNTIFRVGTPFNRIWHNNPFLTGSLQSLATLPETKRRKEFLAPFFSKSSITRVEPYLHRKKLAQFLAAVKHAVADGDDGDEGAKGKVIDFYLMFRCLTADTVMDYCFQQDLGALGEGEEGRAGRETVEAFLKGFDLALVGTYFPKTFGVLNQIIFALPEETRRKSFAPVYGFQMMQRVSPVF